MYCVCMEEKREIMGRKLGKRPLGILGKITRREEANNANARKEEEEVTGLCKQDGNANNTKSAPQVVKPL